MNCSISAVDKFGYCLAISKIFSECVFSDQLPDGPPVKVLVIKSIGLNPVSYTHLTLPTILLV